MREGLSKLESKTMIVAFGLYSLRYQSINLLLFWKGEFRQNLMGYTQRG